MKNYKALINITLRDGILDVQGKAVEHALHSMEFKMMNEIRIGKFVTMNLEANSSVEAKELAEKACEKLIANPIIEDYFVKIEDTGN